MASCNFGASQAANETTANIDSSTRIAQLRQLYFNSYSTLSTTAYDSYRDLLVTDCEAVMEELSEILHKYRGPLDDSGASFEKWAAAHVAKEAQRYKFLAMVLKDYSRFIKAAIYENLWTDSVEDNGVGRDDIYWEVISLVFKKATSLNKKGTAKLSTRLYALAKKHVYFYHNSKNQNRLKAVRKRINGDSGLGVEILSEDELASMKNEAVYNPGYGEAGLSLE